MNRTTELDKGSVVASVTVDEVMASGERVMCWRGHWPDGSAGSVHALRPSATEGERNVFLGGARRLASAMRHRRLPGVATVAAVVPTALAYVTRLSVAGTVADLPILGWGVSDKVVLMQRLCRAIDALHGAGLSHGCLHPTNVLLDDDLAPVVSGTGTLLIAESFGTDARTKHSYAPYAAQELRLGRPPSTRADVFAVGRLLCFILSEEDPDEADEDLPLLASFAKQPAGLVRIIRRATVRDPDLRYLSMNEMLADLERWEDEGAVGLRHPRGLEGSGRQSVTPAATGSPLPGSSPAPIASSRAPASPTPADSGPPTPTPSAGRPERGSANGKPVRRGPRGAAANGRRRQGAAAAPVMLYAGRDTGDDAPLTEGQARAGGLVGLAVLAAALVYAYWRAFAGPGLHLAAVVGAVGISLFVPTLANRALPTRLFAAALFGVAAWLLDPTAVVAQAGRRARYASGDAHSRAERIYSARQRGVTDFGQLDLRGTDFSGMDLSGVSFDNSVLSSSRFDGARLEGISLRDADIGACSFAGADLTKVDVVAARHWVRSTCDERTVMPARWRCRDEHPEAVLETGIPHIAPSSD